MFIQMEKIHLELKVKFVHPRTGEKINLEAELPKYFEDVLKKLRAMN